MTVYLGTQGQIELQRVFEADPITVTLLASDVEATKNRFSVDFSERERTYDPNVLQTGDQIRIRRTDGNALDVITGNTKPGTKKFIHVDQVGGIRLYNTFAHAVTGGTANAVALSTPSSNYEVQIRVEQRDFRTLAQVTSYELNTERETVDTTALSDEFRNRVSSLMSGSGRMTCFWDYTGDTASELPMYLGELILRSQVGSKFRGRFYLKRGGYNPSGIAGRANDAVFYETDGILTAVALQFPTDGTVQMTADFVTTSEIKLKIDFDVPLRVLLEDGDKLLDEENDNINRED
tara:strand:+ start:3930 stop:4808 length:879 start_codon:yes stop_codon:yes gene_type:complete